MPRRHPSVSLPGRRRSILAVLAAGAVAISLAAVAPAAVARGAQTSVAPHTPTAVPAWAGTVRYAVQQPVCAQHVATGYAHCDAIRRVEVAKGTPGAVRYVQAKGVSYGPAGGYTPSDLALAYGFNPAAAHPTQTVAIVDWYDDPDALSNLNSFDRHYGFATETSTSFRKVNQLGTTKPLPGPDGDSATEIALDIEAVRSVCRTCRILLVEARTGSDGNLAAAENTAARLGATEISNSYGETESTPSSSIRYAYRHPGVIITASAGDDGWYDWDYMNENGLSGGGPEFPSSEPYVVSVGGTSLVLASSGHRSAEYVWNDNGADDATGWAAETSEGAGGGGCSTVFASPSWQSVHAGYAAAGCKGGRLGPDVSAIADPQYGFDVYDTYGMGGWGTIGGTSLASPVIAALFALAGGSGGSAYPAASLYVNSTYRATSLYDITQGGNAFCGGDTTTRCELAATAISAKVDLKTTSNPNLIGYGAVDCSFPRNSTPSSPPASSSQCNATRGFDGASGLGTPSSLALFIPTSDHAGVSVRTSHPAAHHAVTLYAKIIPRLSASHVRSIAWSYGDGHSSTGIAGEVRHTYSQAGTYTVSMTSVDSLGQVIIRTARVKVS